MMARRDYRHVNARLPPEILTSVFYILLPTDFDADGTFKKEHWDWIVVSHVCQYWRSVALDSSYLWSYLYYNDNTQKLQVYLERSKNADLKISFWDCRSLTMSVGRTNNLAVLLQQAHKISAIGGDFNHEVLLLLEELCSVLSYDTSRLETLSVSGNTDHLLFSILQINSPLIRNLQLDYIGLTNFFFPRNLVQLRLQMITNVSPKGLLFSLLASPKLEILYLEYISWTENEDVSEVTSDVTASMPYLQRIAISEHIDAESLMVLNSIFSHISTPPDLDWLSQFFIYDTIDSYVEDEFYVKWIKVPCLCQNLIVDLTPSFLGLTLLCGRTRKIPWDLVDDDYTSPNTCKKEVVLTPEGDDLFDAILYLQKIGHVIRSSHLLSVQSITLRFAGTVGDITDEDWLPLLSSLPSVRFLSVMKNCFFQKDEILHQNAANVVRALGWNDVPITTEESNMMICPKLECLTLEIGSEFSKYLFDSLEYGLRMRKQLGFGLKTLKLIVESINETDFTAISNFVEEILEFDCKPTSESGECATFT